MKMKFDFDTMKATVDLETYSKLTQGTQFQKSIGLLSMMSQIWEDNYYAEMDALNLTPERYEEFAVQNKDFFRNLYFRDSMIENPPPGIDLDALNAFFGKD